MTPLASIPPGTRVRIVSIEGGAGRRRRLMEMGLTPGTEVVLISSFPGPVIVEVRGVKIAIGRGMASGIMVEPVSCD